MMMMMMTYYTAHLRFLSSTEAHADGACIYGLYGAIQNCYYYHYHMVQPCRYVSSYFH